MIGLTVRDMRAALRFYGLLGLAVPEVTDDQPYAEVITPNGYRISWNALAMVQAHDPNWVEPAGHRIGLAFLCADPAEVDTLFGAVITAGYTGYKLPWDAPWGQRYAQVLDPDGNIVDLFAPLG